MSMEQTAGCSDYYQSPALVTRVWEVALPWGGPEAVGDLARGSSYVCTRFITWKLWW